jgi:DNA-directed RNA polymerase specialized sigma subunit
MDAKTFLLQYLEYKRLIECKKAENEQWLYLAGGITPPTLGERVQTSGNKHRSEDAIIRYMRKTEENEAAIERYKEKMAEILSVIAKLNNATLRTILLLYYTEGKQLDEIAVEIRYSYPYTKDLHCEALKKIQQIINSLPNPLE